jgi:hypothetical protein
MMLLNTRFLQVSETSKNAKESWGHHLMRKHSLINTKRFWIIGCLLFLYAANSILLNVSSHKPASSALEMSLKQVGARKEKVFVVFQVKNVSTDGLESDSKDISNRVRLAKPDLQYNELVPPHGIQPKELAQLLKKDQLGSAILLLEIRSQPWLWRSSIRCTEISEQGLVGRITYKFVSYGFGWSVKSEMDFEIF